MARYFLEVGYEGTQYSGFQVQKNSNTVQAEVEKAFHTIQRLPVPLTGSSRTDAGVHARQNYFHFDFEGALHPHAVYKLNAVLPKDIVIRNLFLMPAEAHCRFDAVSREYLYRIHHYKNPFITNWSLFYPYKLNVEAMQEAARFLKGQQNFFPFSKANTQVKNFCCDIVKSEWSFEEDELRYAIEANRFLRGMVRLVTATLLKIGRGHSTLQEFKMLFGKGQKCGYSVPSHGLLLKRVSYPENYFPAPALHLGRF